MVSAQSLKLVILSIDAGSSIISDGILLSDSATVSESLLTGESDLIVKRLGDSIVGGSQNDSQPFVMQITTLPNDSQMGVIDRLVNRSLSEKPQIALKQTNWHAGLSRGYWWLPVWCFGMVFYWAESCHLGNGCRIGRYLSLCLVIGHTHRINRFYQSISKPGVLATRGHTITTLAEVTHVAFDKTGTLTYGQPNLMAIETLDVPYSVKQNRQWILLKMTPKRRRDKNHFLGSIAASPKWVVVAPLPMRYWQWLGKCICPLPAIWYTFRGRSASYDWWAKLSSRSSRFCSAIRIRRWVTAKFEQTQASTSVTLSRQDSLKKWQPLAHFFIFMIKSVKAP